MSQVHQFIIAILGVYSETYLALATVPNPFTALNVRSIIFLLERTISRLLPTDDELMLFLCQSFVIFGTTLNVLLIPLKLLPSHKSDRVYRLSQKHKS
ncbi:MAG: hypothetical protein HC820_00725 [Hydrococcus sp. RM1_1_31]|nr:hypothetical protein [Hydrococcus sp. RM1_1_31]